MWKFTILSSHQKYHFEVDTLLRAKKKKKSWKSNFIFRLNATKDFVCVCFFMVPAIFSFNLMSAQHKKELYLTVTAFKRSLAALDWQNNFRVVYIQLLCQYFYMFFTKRETQNNWIPNRATQSLLNWINSLCEVVILPQEYFIPFKTRHIYLPTNIEQWKSIAVNY